MLDAIEVFFTTIALLSLIITTVLFFAYLFKKDSPTSAYNPTVTVLIPFYNENSSTLIKSLEQLEKQDYKNKLQVLLIDDGSKNDTAEYVNDWISHGTKNDYILISKPNNGGRKGLALDYALNTGIATGEVYVVVDSDTYIEDSGIRELVTKLWSKERYAAVCGYITPENYNDSFLGLLQHYEHVSFYGAIRTAQDKLGCVSVLAGAFVAHRASVVKELGGWSEWLAEDIAWCWKAISSSYRTGYAPKAKALTQCPINGRDLFMQRRRWARGRVEAYSVAWKTNWVAGIACTPWFLVTAAKCIFPSFLVLLAFLLFFGLWIPFSIAMINVILNVILVALYVREYRSEDDDIKSSYYIKAPVFNILMDVVTWIPNIFGYYDGISGKEKNWLTR